MAEQLDIKKLLDSGILELYVMGSLAKDENKRIHDLVKENPELQKEVRVIEENLMKAGASHAPGKPRVNTVYQVLNQIESEGEGKTPENGSIIDLLDKKEKDDIKWLQIVAAILLVLSLLVNVFLYLRLDSTNNKLGSIENDLSKAQQTTPKLLQTIQSQSEYIKLLNSPSSVQILLKNKEIVSDDRMLLIYDNPSRKSAITQWTISKPEGSGSFQLWAFYGKEVVNLGALPEDPNKFVFQTLERQEAPTSFGLSFETGEGYTEPSELILSGKLEP